MTTFRILLTIAQAIAWTYTAGRAAGTICRPVILRAADAISWAISEIDWAEVRGIIRDGLVIITAAIITAAQLAIPALIRLSAALGRRWAATVAPAPLVAPFIHPLAIVAAELEAMPASAIRRVTGFRARTSKRQLVAAYCAA